MRAVCPSLFLFSLIVAGCDHNSKRTERQSDRVVILTIDGPRFSETWGDSMSRLIPHLANDMAPMGAFAANFHNDGVTETTAGHTALVTGVYQNIDNSGMELPQNPSVFQLWRAAAGTDSTSAWIVTSKDKLEVLSNCLDSLWHDQYRPMRDCGLAGLGSGLRDDSLTLLQAEDIMITYQPSLMLVHFKEPDVTAHSGDWNGYLAQIRRTDRLAYSLWNFIESNVYYANRTTLFVTHDHGRHLDSVSTGFSSHGDDCAGCRKIACLVLGPDIKQGTIVPTAYNQTDLAVTVAEMMGITIPQSSGHFMTEIFLNPF